MNCFREFSLPFEMVVKFFRRNLTAKKVSILFLSTVLLFLLVFKCSMFRVTIQGPKNIIFDSVLARLQVTTPGPINIIFNSVLARSKVTTPRPKNITCDSVLARSQGIGLDKVGNFSYKPISQTDSTFIIPSTEMTFVKSSKENREIETFINNRTTIVTAYFNLGTFLKAAGLYYTTNKYHQWASIFKFILNPLVVYTDSDEFAAMMLSLREKIKVKTTILKIRRLDVWGFQLYDKICAIFLQPEYPLVTLNTERPDYSCAMHSKFVLVGDAIRRNLYNTEFYQWLDIGLFRHIVSEKKYFQMSIPKNFDSTKVAYTRIEDNPMSKSPDIIIKQNMHWVSGATFLGRKDVLLKFESIYKKSVMHFLSHKLINTDQQMLYAIYSNEGRKILKPDVEIQEWIPDSTSAVDPWFYLGYICRYIVSNITEQLYLH